VVKRKMRASVFTADGQGGMAPVEDRRFEKGAWPIARLVERERADRWLTYFRAECTRRGWSSSGQKQIDHGENSGTVTVKGVHV
jgi:hypothetical protein